VALLLGEDGNRQDDAGTKQKFYNNYKQFTSVFSKMPSPLTLTQTAAQKLSGQPVIGENPAYTSPHYSCWRLWRSWSCIATWKFMEVGRQTDIVVIDFSKAFDKVSHAQPLYRLQRYGVLGWP
jgi:hypothetical protein